MNNNILYNKNCLFCNFKKDEYTLENKLAYAIYDGFPVSKGHMLFITKRHIQTFFEITNEEKIAIFDLINRAKEILDRKYNPDGYNIGTNCGKYAGQSIMHVHIHLIPRYKNDVQNPLGGIRGVIPNKKEY